jgi:hypothetical protein
MKDEQLLNFIFISSSATYYTTRRGIILLFFFSSHFPLIFSNNAFTVFPETYNESFFSRTYTYEKERYTTYKTVLYISKLVHKINLDSKYRKFPTHPYLYCITLVCEQKKKKVTFSAFVYGELAEIRVLWERKKN